MLTSTRLGRYVLWNKPTDQDHLRFPAQPLEPSPSPLALPEESDQFDFRPVVLKGPDGVMEAALPGLLDRTGTTALLVVTGGRIAYEWYADGVTRSTAARCFSVTKSFASALVGAAIADGLIAGIEARVEECLPEFAGGAIGALTIRHLLEMCSGIRFREGPLPWSDDAICYFSPDCRAAARRAPVVEPVGAQFHYNDYHPFLIGMIIERATGETISAYAERRLWRRIGAQFPASLTLDSLRNRFEHLESGLNAAPIDLARFGLLFLREGRLGDDQILPRSWVLLSTGPEGARRGPAWFARYEKMPWGRVFATGRYFYKFFWWGFEAASGDYDYFAMGALGAHIYVSPRLDTVIVRASSRFPRGIWWAPIFRQMAEQVGVDRGATAG